MATMNLVILSSSPSKPHNHAALTMSSSQNGLSSPSTLFRHNPKLKMPAAIAKRISTTTPLASPGAEKPTNDSSIWDVPDDDPSAQVSATKPAAKPRGRPKKGVAAVVKNADGEPPKRRGRPKKVRTGGEEEAPLKEKAARTPRVNKADEEGQTKIAKGRVTKASVDSATRKSKKTDTVSSHFATTPSDFMSKDDIPPQQDLDLKKAGERRMSWTPAKERSHYPYHMEESTPQSTHNVTAAAQGFGSLLDSYGYSKTETLASKSIIEDNSPARKRKLIELVKTNNASTASKTATSAKPKAVRKKPRTITDKATAKYATIVDEEVESSPILQYFTREGSGVDPSGAPRTKARKIVTNLGKGKRATEPASVLLPPQAALDHADRQEFIFGTSSQLAREDDPAILRDLRQAIQLSNQYDVEDPFAEPLPSMSSSNISGKTTLWEAALQIEDEGANDIEVLDLSRSSQVERHFMKETTTPAAAEAETSLKLVPTAEPDGDWHRLDDTPLPAPASQHAPALAALRASSPSPIMDASPPRNLEAPLRAETSQALYPTPADSDSSKPASEAPMSHTVPAKSTVAQCPNYDSFSTTDLTKEIAKYKFKPIKKREDMVSLLQKCWEGKQKQTQRALYTIPKPVEAPPPSSRPPPPPQAPASKTLASPPKKRGRPKKVEPTTASMRKLDPKPTASTKAVETAPSASAPALSTPRKRGRPRKVLPTLEDIPGAEGPPTPSPPRIHASQLRSPPPLEIVHDFEDDADITLIPLSPSSAERELFTAISRAITSQSASRDSKRLSWYEKILLYDPILLEDLTKWLNEGGLGKVGYDGEVQPLQVKMWCQRKSICCLFKESKRNRGVGGVKKIGRE